MNIQMRDSGVISPAGDTASVALDIKWVLKAIGLDETLREKG